MEPAEQIVPFCGSIVTGHRDQNTVRAEMAQARRDLESDAEEVVGTAIELTSWRHYVERYPWVSLAVAGALGYLIVPRRVELLRPDAEALERLVKDSKLDLKVSCRGQGREGFGRKLLGTAANGLVRVAVGYLGRRLAESAASRSREQPEERQAPFDRPR